MNQINRAVPKLLLTAFLFASQATYAGLLEGLTAYDHKDWSVARQELMPLAEKGNAKAMGRIGSLYRDGKGGVAQDYTEAMAWYRKAADGGDDYAQNNLGVMYQNEMGVPYNEKEAISLYRKAAKQGNAVAKENLAGMLAPKRRTSSSSYYPEQTKEPTDYERSEKLRADACATSGYDCNTNWSGGKY